VWKVDRDCECFGNCVFSIRCSDKIVIALTVQSTTVSVDSL